MAFGLSCLPARRILGIPCHFDDPVITASASCAGGTGFEFDPVVQLRFREERARRLVSRVSARTSLPNFNTLWVDEKVVLTSLYLHSLTKRGRRRRKGRRDEREEERGEVHRLVGGFERNNCSAAVHKFVWIGRYLTYTFCCWEVKQAQPTFLSSKRILGVSRQSSPGAGIMEADDSQVMTVFTVQPSFHHRHSTNRVS